MSQELGLTAAANNIRSMLYVLAKGGRVNHMCDRENKLVPLHVAAHSGHALSTVFLILNGANMDAVDAQVRLGFL
jgi:uncharacterized protein YjhX (UPF0386 family)